MTARDDTGPIVVGIDGSTASIDAALWAINEALHRGVPRRLVSATNVLAARVAEPTRSPELNRTKSGLRRHHRDRQAGRRSDVGVLGTSGERVDRRISLRNDGVRGVGRHGRDCTRNPGIDGGSRRRPRALPR